MSRQRGAQTVWECEMCTGSNVVHTAHYPNEHHSHHILSRTKLCDHWSSASSGFQFKTCQSRSSLTLSIQTLVTETSFHCTRNVTKWFWMYPRFWLKNAVFTSTSTNALWFFKPSLSKILINLISCSREVCPNSYYFSLCECVAQYSEVCHSWVIS